MKAEDFHLWDIEVFEGCEIKCPECEQWSSHGDWTETKILCDICGSHPVIRCPHCYKMFDSINGPHFEVRKPV